MDCFNVVLELITVIKVFVQKILKILDLMEKPNTHMDNIMYKCRKEYIKAHRRKLCQWNGALGDFVQHVRKKHENSFHTMKKNKILFKWQLPLNRCQETKGIMSYRLGHIYYKLCYIKEFQSLFYSVYNLHEANANVTFVVRLHNGAKTYSVPPCKTLNIKHINDAINESNSVIIHKDVLADFTDQNRYFTMCFEIIKAQQ